MNEPIFLKPHFTRNVWGGTRLRDEFKYDVEGDHTGECWGISAHPHGESVVRGGEYDGLRLSEVWYGHREIFARSGTRFRRATDPFPLLIKLIDAHDDLSIQVHPDDNYAMVHENGAQGKCECWYVLDAPKDGTLIVGHRAKDAKELNELIDNGEWDKLVNEVPVSKGDVIPLRPGTMHAIKSGVLLLEAQQNSDVTYRVYDYDRLWNGEKRKLHIKQAKDILTVPDEDGPGLSPDVPRPSTGAGSGDGGTATGHKEFLADCGHFIMERIVVDGEGRLKNYPDLFAACCVIEGEGEISGISTGIGVKKGDFFIIPIDCGVLDLTGNMTIVIVRPG